MFYFTHYKSVHTFLYIAFVLQLVLVNPCSSKDIDFVDIQHLSLQNKSEKISSVDYVDDIQGVSIINFTGNYDKNINGVFNSEARKAVLQKFYENNEDDYDFVYIFTEFEFDNGGANAFAAPLMNDVEGIGRPIFDNSSLFFSENLQSIIDMSNMDSWSFSPINTLYDSLLDTMMHEFMHRWGSFVKYTDNQSQVSNRLLGKSSSHWSYFFNSNASVMYGSLWKENQTGQFQTIDTMHGLSPLDLYLSGFIGKESVTDMFVINNASNGLNTDLPPLIGTEINGDSESVSINDIISNEGVRIPNYLNSQHDFKVKFILLKHPDDELNSLSIAKLYTLQSEFEKRFFAETRGIGQIIWPTNLNGIESNSPEILSYGPSLNASFNLSDAVNFLLLSENTNDWWQDRSSSRVRDTVAVIKALQLIIDDFPEAQSKLSSAILWINSHQAENNDEIAWMLTSGVLTNEKQQVLIEKINSDEKVSGGWGLKKESTASPYDTALVIDALFQAQGEDFDLNNISRQYVIGHINQDSGLGYVSDGKSNLLASALLLKSIDKISNNPQDKDQLVAYLLSKKRLDNSYGNDPETGTPHETALVIKALLSLQDDSYINEIELAKSALNTMQTSIGSVRGSVYSTALALSVFNDNSKANLTFNDVTVTNSQIITGEQVIINYTVINSGNSTAKNIEVTVFKNVVDSNNQLAQVTIPEITALQSIENNFTINTSTLSNDSVLIVVIDVDNVIDESNEDDNVYTLPISVMPIDTSPELAFNVGEVVFTPTLFDSIPFTVNSSAVVANLSLNNINNVNVALSQINSDGTQTLLETQVLNIGSQTTEQYGFSVEIIQGNLDVQLILEIDPENTIAERNENNNSYTKTINKIQSVDLAFSNDDITLSSQITRGEVENISFGFRNMGTEIASSFTIRAYADSQLIYEFLIPELLSGMQLTRELTWQPQETGNFIIRFVLDEDNTLAETNETNNQIIIPVEVTSNTLTNISIKDTDVTLSPDPALQGQNLHFSLNIHNTSDLDSGMFDIIVYQKSAAGIPNIVLSTQENVTSINANSSSIIEWDLIDVTLKGQHTLIFEIDSSNSLAEFNENDNIVFKEIIILSKPDAQVSAGGFQLTPSIPVLGESISVDAIINNVGEQDLTNLSVTLYYDKSQQTTPIAVETQMIDILLGGESLTNNFVFNYPSDIEVDSLIIIVDESNNIDEGRENNNQATIIVGNQLNKLYPTERYFSPNGDHMKDETLIVFNVDDYSNYKIEILNENFDQTQILEPETFQNTNFGDVIWDGKTNKGIIARDGDYSLRLLNNEDVVIASTLVTLDTNRSPLFESMLDNNGHYTDLLNCLGSDFSELKYARDGKSFYTTRYRNLFGEAKQGLFEIKSDGSQIKSLLPTAPAGEFWVLKGGNIIIESKSNNISSFYFYNTTTGSINLISEIVTGVYNTQIFAITEEFLLLTVSNDYQKIFFDGITPQQTRVFNQSVSLLGELESGVIMKNNTGSDANNNDLYDLYFINFDLTIEPNLIASNAFIKYDHISVDNQHLIYNSEGKVHFYSITDGSLEKIYDKEISSNDTTGITTHNELVIMQEGSTIAIYNSNGNQILVTEPSFPLSNFDEFINSGQVNLEILVEPQARKSSPPVRKNVSYVYFTSEYMVDSKVKQELINLNDATDKKELVLLVKNTLVGTFDLPPCDEQLYYCGNWPEFSTDYDLTSIQTLIKINYDDLLNIDFQIEDFLTVDESNPVNFSPIQEGRSSLIRTKSNSTYELINKNDLENGLNNYELSEDHYIDKSFPMLSTFDFSTFNIMPNNKRVEAFNSVILRSDLLGLDETECPDNGSNYYVYRSKENLYADIKLLNNQQAIEITATTFDENFARYEVHWASADQPNQWNLLKVSEQAVNNEIILNWIPDISGFYKIKISSYDKAGNKVEAIEKIAINQTNVTIKNINVTPKHFSPNGDGVKDFINIEYEIVSALNLIVEIQNESGLIVRTFEREYLNAIAIDSIQWDGRGNNGNVLPDGKYSIFVQSLKFQVFLDTQPPAFKELEMNLVKLGYPSIIGHNLIGESYFSGLMFPGVVYSGLNLIEETVSGIYQRYNDLLAQWQNVEPTIPLHSTNMTEMMTGQYRALVEDEAGNTGIINYPVIDPKFKIVEFFSIANSDEVFSFEYHGNRVPSGPEPVVFEWFNADNFAFAIQAFTYGNIESIQLKIGYNDELEYIVSSNNFVDFLDPSLADKYFGNQYIGINLNGNALFDINKHSTQLPVLLVEIEPEDIPDVPGPIFFQFSIKLSDQITPIVVKQTVEFTSKKSEAPGVSFTKLTFNEQSDLLYMSENAQIAYEKIINTVPSNSNLVYLWVYHNDNKIIHDDFLTVTTNIDGITVSTQTYDADFIDLTSEYSSWLYILEENECIEKSSAKWQGLLESNDVINSLKLNYGSGFCIKPKIEANYYLGEFCNNSTSNNNSMTRFKMTTEDIDISSTLPILVELYRVTNNQNNVLIFSDTNPQQNLVENEKQNAYIYDNTFDYDTSNLSLGLYHFELIFRDFEGNEVKRLIDIFLTEEATTSQIESPIEGTHFCGTQSSGSQSIKIEMDALIQTNSPYGVQSYLFINGIGLQGDGKNYQGYNIHEFPNTSLNYTESVSFNVESYQGPATVLLETFNLSGYSSCTSVNLSIDTLIDYRLINEVEELTKRTLNRNVFSPNSDGKFDVFRLATIQANEDLTIEVEIFDINEKHTALDRITSDSLQEGESRDYFWDGLLDGNLAHDGRYWAIITIIDSCGLTKTIENTVTIDTTAPMSNFISPTDNGSLNSIQRVVINIEEENLTNFLYSIAERITVEYFYNNVWNELQVISKLNPEEGLYEVQLDWNLSNLPLAVYPLRITATDVVENSATVLINPELLAVQNIFWGYAVSPLFFSPNADTIKDVVTIDFGLNVDSVVSIDVLDNNQNVVRSLLNNQAFSAGSHQQQFNGMDDGSTVLNNGLYSVKITASEAANLNNSEDLSLNTTIDNLAPILQWLPPLDSITKGEGFAQLQLLEINPLSVVASNQQISPLGASNSVLSSNQSGVFDLFDLSALDETHYQLQAIATDLAGNTRTINLDYLVDKTLPIIELTTPVNDAYVGGNDDMVLIAGSIDDINFASFDLSIAEDPVNPVWQSINTETILVENQFEYQWLNAVNDGSYLLRLSVYDHAGWLAETSVNIVLDKTAPLSHISLPINNATVGNATEIIGTANDDNFNSYTLSYKSTSETEWTLFNISQAPLVSATLGQLPEDLVSGNYEVKLSVQDKVGLSSHYVVSITVDTLPPATPENFTAQKININQVNMTWDSVNNSDMGGYIIYRNGQAINPQAPIINLSQNQYIDEDLSDGEYNYQIASVDLLGNISELSFAVPISIDSTPPDVIILSPADGQKVNNTIDITGSAVSLLDFNSFALYARLQGQPAPGMLINQSPIAVTNGLLGVLDTSNLNQNTDYIVRLEAADNSENSVFVEHSIFIDNNAPNSPQNLTYQVQNGNDVSLQWDANSDTDLAGYLVLLNGVVITGSGNGELSIGNGITQTTFDVTNLNDGIHVFNVIAIDETGNISLPSNTIQVIINLRDPDTIIVKPFSLQKFDAPILFEASSDDTDITQIKFEYSSDNSNWIELDTDLLAPFQTILNPVDLNLVYGNIYLRATATDTATQFDATPAQITVEYADITPPQAIQGLINTIQGGAISLDWGSNLETDLAGYIIKRIVNGQTTQLTASPIQANNYVDTGLDDANYQYQVLAVDNYNNESIATETSNLQVFSINVEQPYSPLLTPNQINISGETELTDGDIQITLQNTNGTNTLSDVLISNINNRFNQTSIDLATGLNSLELIHVVSGEHQSKVNTVQVEVSPVPNAPLNFSAVVNNLNSDLSWQAPDNNTFGYLPYRGGMPVFPTTQITSGISYSASSNVSGVQYVVDDNQQTTWSPSTSDIFDTTLTFVELDFDQSYWVTQIELNWGHFNTQVREPSAYEIQYSSQVGWISIADLTASNQQNVTHVTDQPYLTDKVRLVIKNPIGVYQNIELVEFKVNHQPLIIQTAVSINEIDGTYNYQVSAINNYGFESLRSANVELSIGDIIPPESVTLNAEISGLNDVLLNWGSSVSVDVSSYWLFRNNDLIYITNDSNTFIYTDIALANGTYEYYVRAVDAVGNASDKSNVVDLTIQQQAIAAPSGLTIYPLITGQSLVLDWEQTQNDRWHHYNIYRSLETGQSFTKIYETIENHFNDSNLDNGTVYYYVITNVDEFNNESVTSNEVFATPNDNVAASMPVIQSPTVYGQPIELDVVKTDISGESDPGVYVDLYNNNMYKTTVLSSTGYDDKTILLSEVDSIKLSKNGQWFAYSDYYGLFNVASVNSDEVNSLDIFTNDFIWNHEGNMLYVILSDQENGGFKLETYDTELTGINTLFSASEIYSAVPSPDETKVFYQGQYTNPQTTESNEGLWLFDVADASAIEITGPSALSTSNKRIAWSNNGENLAFINNSNGGELYIYHIPTQQLTLIDSDFSNSNKLEWSPNSTLLIYDKLDDEQLFMYDTLTLQSNQLPLTSNTNRYASFSPNGEKIAYRNDCCKLNIFDLSDQSIETIFTSYNSIRDLKWTETQEILVYERNKLNVLSPPGTFVFLDMFLDSGVNQLHTIARDDSGLPSSESLPIIIKLNSSELPDLMVSTSNLTVSPQSALQGASFIASVEVLNNSQQIVMGAELLILLSKPDGTTQAIDNELGLLNLQPQETQSIFIELGTQHVSGEYILQVTVDPQHLITEVNENNNSASQTFIVLENFNPTLQLFVSSQHLSPEQQATIGIKVFNPAQEFTGEVTIDIRDENGHSVIDLQQYAISELANNNAIEFNYNWQTIGLISGNYEIIAKLNTTNGSLITQQLSQVDILSFAQFQLALDTINSNIVVGDDLEFSTRVNYVAGNMAQDATLTWQVVDDTQQLIWNSEVELTQMLHGFNTVINKQWQSQTAGEYELQLQFNADNDQQSLILPFTVMSDQAQLSVQGDIAEEPRNIILGEDLDIVITITNTGNINLDQTPITIKLLSTDLSSVLASYTRNLSLNPSLSSELSTTLLTQGLTSSDNYLLALYADLSTLGGNADQLIDTRSVSAIDTTAPEVTIISPSLDSLNPANVNVNFSITDLNSLVASIVLQGADINQGTPLNLNVNTVNNNYQYQFLDLQDGVHQLTISAVDDFGNSAQAPLSFSVDATSPIISISGVSDGISYNSSITSNVFIIDENLIDSQITLNALPITEINTINEEGSYFLSVRAEDSVGNRSIENINFSIDLTVPVVTILFPEDNAVIENLSTSINGITEAHSLVEMAIGTYQTNTQSDANGNFNFTDVPLVNGNNSIVVSATDQANNQSLPESITVNSIQTDGCSIFGFKSATPFDAFVFTDFTAQSSAVEGRLAAGNNVLISRYEIGQQLTAETAGNVLIAGGDINFAYDRAYYGNILASGDANIGQIVIDNMYPNTQVLDNAQIPIDFTGSYQQLKLFSNALAELPVNSSSVLVGRELQLQGNCMAELQTYTLEAIDLQNISNITYDCLAENAYIILNILGDNIQFNHVDLSQLYSVRNRIIWNFYQADTVVIHNIGIQGSMLAVDALITGDEPIFKDSFEDIAQTQDKGALGSGFINGQVISREFNSQQKINHQALACSHSIQIDAAPIAIDQTLNIELNTPITFALNAFDENSTTLQYQQISQVSLGELTGQMPNLTYTPASDFEGTVSFEYQVTDEFGKTKQATVTIVVVDSATTMKVLALFNSYLLALVLNLLANYILWRRK